MGLFHSRDGPRLDGARETPQDVVAERRRCGRRARRGPPPTRVGNPTPEGRRALRRSQGATSARREDDSRHIRAVRARGDRSCDRRQTTRVLRALRSASPRTQKRRAPELVVDDATPLKTSGKKSSPGGTRCGLPAAPRERRGRRLRAWNTGTAERHRDERHTARDPPAVAGADEVEAATAELPADRRRQRRQAHMGDTDRQMGGEPPTDSAPCHPGVENPGEVLDNRQGLASANRRHCQSS